MKLEIVNARVTPLCQFGRTGRDPWSPRPGDMCYVWNRPKSVGTIIAIQDEESFLVLWSSSPGAPTLEENMAKQIRDEIDVDIIRDLLAMERTQ